MAKALRIDEAVMVGLDDEQRKQECFAIISKTLARYGCALEPICIITLRGIELRVDVKVLPKLPQQTDKDNTGG